MPLKFTSLAITCEKSKVLLLSFTKKFNQDATIVTRRSYQRTHTYENKRPNEWDASGCIPDATRHHEKIGWEEASFLSVRPQVKREVKTTYLEIVQAKHGRVLRRSGGFPLNYLLSLKKTV